MKLDFISWPFTKLAGLQHMLTKTPTAKKQPFKIQIIFKKALPILTKIVSLLLRYCMIKKKVIPIKNI